MPTTTPASSGGSPARYRLTGVDAIVLAGGRAERLGQPKHGIEIGGQSLLGRALDAVVTADSITVVGPADLPVPAGVALTREDPPFGGPVAGLAAGISVGHAPLVLLLAVDLTGIVHAVAALAEARRTTPDADGWVGIDPSGARQVLTAIYRRDAIVPLLAEDDPAGRSMRRLVSSLELIEVPLSAAASFDIDTPADLDAARRQDY